MSPALAGGYLSIVPPGKSHVLSTSCSSCCLVFLCVCLVTFDSLLFIPLEQVYVEDSQRLDNIMLTSSREGLHLLLLGAWVDSLVSF